jgi:hypothetical protein
MPVFWRDVASNRTDELRSGMLCAVLWSSGFRSTTASFPFSCARASSCASVTGRLRVSRDANSFWLPCPMRSCTASGDVSSPVARTRTLWRSTTATFWSAPFSFMTEKTST